MPAPYLGAATIQLPYTSTAQTPFSIGSTIDISAKEDKANKGVANGYAPLDETGKVPSGKLPFNILQENDDSEENIFAGSINTSAGFSNGDPFNGGSINTSAGGGSINTSLEGGSINTSGDGNGNNGGSINTSGGGDGNGGSIDTSNIGGSINTSNLGGSINTSGDGDNAGGSITTVCGTGGYQGGSINTSGGNDGNGGSINTSDGGGPINTRGTGSIGLGNISTRTTLVGSASGDKTITLPNQTGTLVLASQAIAFAIALG